MNRPIHILIYGNSIFLTAIGDSLRARPALVVRQLNAALADAAGAADAPAPDAVILAQSDDAGPLNLDLLHRFPGASVIGVDVHSSRLTVLSSQERRAASLDDLVSVITQFAARDEAHGP